MSERRTIDAVISIVVNRLTMGTIQSSLWVWDKTCPGLGRTRGKWMLLFWRHLHPHALRIVWLAWPPILMKKPEEVCPPRIPYKTLNFSGCDKRDRQRSDEERNQNVLCSFNAFLRSDYSHFRKSFRSNKPHPSFSCTASRAPEVSCKTIYLD